MTQRKKSASGNRLLWILGFLAIAMLALFAVGKSQGWFGKEEALKVAVQKVEKRTLVELVSARGKIYPESEIKLSPDVSGEVKELLIEEGDSVSRGQHLVTIDPEIYYSVIERAEAAVNAQKSTEANARARISQLQTQVDKGQRDFQTNKQLYEQKVISKFEYENSEASLQNLLGEMKAANETAEGAGFGVKSALANLKEAKENLSKTKIYAPIDGVVSKLSIEKGERVVGTSQFQGTEIIRIASFNNMEAHVEVSENDVLKVSEGDTALIEVDAYLDRTFKGLVFKVANSSVEANMLSSDQTTNFMVKILLLAEDYEDLMDGGKRIPFRPGMSASADIQTNKIKDVLAVPIQAVTTRSMVDSLEVAEVEEEDLQEVVFLIDGAMGMERAVKTGIQDDSYIQIIEGIEEGVEIVTAPYRAISKKLEDSTEVEVVKMKELFADQKK